MTTSETYLRFSIDGREYDYGSDFTISEGGDFTIYADNLSGNVNYSDIKLFKLHLDYEGERVYEFGKEGEIEKLKYN